MLLAIAVTPSLSSAHGREEGFPACPWRRKQLALFGGGRGKGTLKSSCEALQADLPCTSHCCLVYTEGLVP